MRIEKNGGSHSDAPAEVLGVSQLMSQMPERQRDIIDFEIHSRERERMMFHEMRKLFSWHWIQILKSVLGTGVIAFSVAWSVSQLAAVGDMYVQARKLQYTIPVPLDLPKIDIGSYVPTSTSLEFATRLPHWGMQEVIMITIAAMAVILVEKLITALWQWRTHRKLLAAEHELEDEIAELKALR